MEVLDYRQIEKGSFKGSFNLKIPAWGGIIIRGMTHFNNGTKEWVGFPAAKYEKDGEAAWYAHLKFEDREVENRFLAAALKAAKGCSSSSAGSSNMVSSDGRGKVGSSATKSKSEYASSEYTKSDNNNSRNKEQDDFPF